MAMKAAEENKRLSRIRGADFPLTAALVKIAGATRGMHRRLDLGRARAFADPIDLVPLQQVRVGWSVWGGWMAESVVWMTENAGLGGWVYSLREEQASGAQSVVVQIACVQDIPVASNLPNPKTPCVLRHCFAQVRDALDANLQQLLAFEKAYGKQLTAEYQDRPFRNYPGQANPLTADPGSPARGGARKRPASANRALRPTRESSSAYSSSSAATSIAPSSAQRAGGLGSAAGRSGAGSYREPPSPSRPESARSAARPRSRPHSAASSRAPSSRLLEPTASHTAYLAATNSGGGGGSRPGSAAPGSRPGSRPSSRPSSASRQRPPMSPVPAWATAAAASDDPHLRKLAEHEASSGEMGAMPPLGREHSASSQQAQPWHTGASAGLGLGGGAGGGGSFSSRAGGGLLASRPSGSIADVSVGDGGAGAGAGGGDPRLAGRQEYRPPSERSLLRPSASYGSRTPGSSKAPSAEPSAASVNGGGGEAAASGVGGGGDGGSNASSRPNSAPARRPGGGSSVGGGSVRGSVAFGAGGGDGSGAGMPAVYGKIPLPPSARRQLPMKSAMLGFEGEGLEGGASGGLPFLSAPDPNAPPAGAGASGAGSRPSSAGRRSFGPAGFRMDSGNSRTSQGWV